jgi:PIN domain nuclease of toxin-antitoxin system
VGSNAVTHLLDTPVWEQRAFDERLPSFVVETLEDHEGALALADISIWEVAKLCELGRLNLSIPMDEFF